MTITDLKDSTNLNTCIDIVLRIDHARKYVKQFIRFGGSWEDARSTAALAILRLGVRDTLSVATNLRRWSGYTAAELCKVLRQSRVYIASTNLSPMSSNIGISGNRRGRGLRPKLNSIIDMRTQHHTCGEDIFDEIPDTESRAWLREYYTKTGEGSIHTHAERQKACRLRKKYREHICRVAAA